ncbi:MAG: glycosyltransferase family 9 protein [Candidatus Aminicenantes bacterium]|nr:glycosyltransferase family 9 protein [Candidatus Aminicenantes bacterium]
MTTPSISALKNACPGTSLFYVVEEPYRELVEGNPHLDEIFVIDKTRGNKEFFRIIRRIRKNKFDAVIDFHGGPRAALITLLSRAKWKVGYQTKCKSYIYHFTIPRSSDTGPIHSVKNHINLTGLLGADTDTIPPLRLPPSNIRAESKVEEYLKEMESEEKRNVVIHISAGNRFRDWGTEKISRLISLLGRLSRVRIALIGDNNDRQTEAKILKTTSLSLDSFVGKLNLKELQELISHAALFVGADSGPMHIAAAVSTPIVALFGPTIPAHFGPWKARATIIEKTMDCRPCKQKSCVHGDFRCLRDISPDEVYEACLDYLK